MLKFASLVKLVDEETDLDSTLTPGLTHCNTAVTDTATELLWKQHRQRKPCATLEILDLCDQR